MTEASPMRPVKEREREEEGEVEVGVGTEGERLTATPALKLKSSSRSSSASASASASASKSSASSAPKSSASSASNSSDPSASTSFDLSKSFKSSKSSKSSKSAAGGSLLSGKASETTKKTLPTAALAGTRPHVRLPTPDDNLNYKCKICLKVMPLAAMYKIHAPCFTPDACTNCGFLAGGVAQLRAHRLEKHPRDDKDRAQWAKQAAATKKRTDELTAARQKSEDEAADREGKRRKWTRGKGKDPCSNPDCNSTSLYGNFLTDKGWPLCNPCDDLLYRTGLKVSADASRIRRRIKEAVLADSLSRFVF